MSKSTDHLLRLAAYAYGALAVFAVFVAVLGGSAAREAMVSLLVIAVAPAAVVLHRVHRFPGGFIAGIGLLAVVYALFAATPLLVGGRAEIVASSLLDLFGNLVIIGLLAVSVRRRRGRLDAGDILDGAIIALGAWLVAWITLVRPMAQDAEVDALALVLDASYLPISVPIVGLTMMFLFSGRLDRAANWLVATALIANVAGDLIYALQETRGVGTWAYGVADLLYIACFASLGADGWTMAAPSEAYSRRRIDLGGRTAALALSLVVPVMVLAVVRPSSTTDLVIRAISALVLL
ncbi:MAG: hypothetical protein AAGG08_09245, partial [Actinomycetota bacterium]